MAEPLSLAASITSIVTVGLHITNVVTQFIVDTPSEPKSIRSLGAELESLCSILVNIRDLAQGSALNSPALQSPVLVQILYGVKGGFEDLQKIVDDHAFTLKDGLLQKRWKQVRLVFRESEVEDLQRSIDAYKSALLMTLAFAERAERTNNALATDDITAEMAEVPKELADVQALCQQLLNIRRPVSRLATSQSSLHLVRPSGNTVSLARRLSFGTSESTTSAKRTMSFRSNLSIRSVGNFTSSHWAASIIDRYCSELTQIAGQSPEQQDSTTGSSTIDPSVSAMLHIPVSSSPGESSRQAPRTTDPRSVRKAAISKLRTTASTWSLPFLRPTAPTYAPVIIPTSAATDNKYHFHGLLFYPAPELVAGSFTAAPLPGASVDEKDTYVRRCVERNVEFVVARVGALRGEIGTDLKVSLGIMKIYWKRHALHRMDSRAAAVLAPFVSQRLPKVDERILRIYGFLLPETSQSSSNEIPSGKA